MPLITLTTDFGTCDHYAASVKGELLKAVPEASIIDISHDITPFDIMHGAFVLKNSYHHFPLSTYHLIGVNLNSEAGMDHLVVQHRQYTFIGPDNGIFGLLWDGEIPEKIFRLNVSEIDIYKTLPMMDIYVRAVRHLVNGGYPEEIGVMTTSFRQSTMGLPILSANHIRATIIYFDRFENAVVNIRKEEFEKIQQQRGFVIYFKRYDDIDIISKNYFDVAESEKVCLFNSSGYFEISINKGNAMGLLNLSVGDIVQIEFK